MNFIYRSPMKNHHKTNSTRVSKIMSNSVKKKAAIIMLMAAIAVCGQAEVTLPHDTIVCVVASSQTPLEKRVTGELCAYLGKVLKKSPQIVPDLSKVPGTTSAIILSSRPLSEPVALSAPQGSPEAYAVLTTSIGKRPVVLAVGNTDKGMKRAVQRLVIKSRQEKDALVIPDLALSEKPWIPEREYTHLSVWTPSRGRGTPVPTNTNVDNRVDTNLFNDEQLSNYAAMFDWFGFSGVQLFEDCVGYVNHKSPDACHRWEKVYARAARENGQNISIDLWAAEFQSWGWTDPEVAYAVQEGKPAFEDPKVRKAFEKAYDIYAEMAPFVDRIVTQIYDPGALKTPDDIVQAMQLLTGKFKQKNPSIKTTINGWRVPQDVLEALAQAGFKDFTLTSCPSEVPASRRTAFHEWGKERGLNLGMWSWHLAEIETDGIPAMHVNAQLYKRFCQQIKDGVMKIRPITYWSEMEGYHLNNVFTMYAASQLLWNPDGDPHEILGEVCEGIFGGRNGNKVLAAVELIQDCRSGPKWETYWFDCPEYRQGTADPKEDLRRADESIAALEGMQSDPDFVPKFPLPVPPATFVDLMLPHLKQIRALAAFRVEMNHIREAANKGAKKDQLVEMVMKAWQPIPYYNVWMGTFGLPEREAQERIVRCLCKDLNLQIVDQEYTNRDCDFRKKMGVAVWEMFRGGKNDNVR